MPSYKLSYFKAKGRGELARLMFAAAGKEFEDERLAGEEWLAFKPSKYIYCCYLMFLSVLLCEEGCLLCLRIKDVES